MSMCSPVRSGSIPCGASIVMTLPLSSVTSGTRCGRPWASMPDVESSTSTVRFVVATLFSRLLASRQTATHLFGQVFERLRDVQLVHGVARFRVRGERLPKLLGATEAAAQREVLPERIAFVVLLPHEDAAQIRVSFELDA